MTDCSCTNFPASLGNVTFGASVGIGTTAPAAPLVVVGTGANAVATAGVVADHAGVSTDRVRLTIGNTNAGTAPGATSRSAELQFYGSTPDGTALQAMFELGTDAEKTGTQSLYVYDDVAKVYRLYLGPTGNLGVGTSTPAAALHVKQDTANVIALVDAAADAESSQLALGAAGALIWQIYKPGSSKDLRFARSGVGDQVTIQDGSGNVGIGTNSPDQRLHVVAAGSGATLLVESTTAGATDTALAIKTPDREWKLGQDVGGVGVGTFTLWDRTAGASRLVVDTADNVGVGTTSPDYPLDVNGTVRCTGVLLGGDQLMFGALKDSTGKRTNVDAEGCYYAD